MRHVLCVHLRHWPIDRLRRRRPELRGRPLVLTDTQQGNRQTIVHVSPETPADIRPGMALAAAKARHAGLLDLPATPAADLHSLEALGHWLMRFSPSVCVYPPSSLFLDATGLERLFGGLVNFHRRIVEALASLRVTAAVAIAPTPGAAWALAAFSRGPHVVTPERVLPALSPLPPEAIRLDSDTVGVLSALGVRTIRSLLQLPRRDLATRFGPAILTRIDQATGAVNEPLTFLVHRSKIRATLEFEGAIECLDAIRFAVQDLVQEVVKQLAHRGLGARALRLTFQPPYSPPVEKVVRLTRPCRNESALFKVISCALETLQSDNGFVAASLSVDHTERLGDEQAALVGGEEERDAAELDHLVARLRARLDRAVEWGELVESNVPEHASRCRDNATVVVASHARSAVDLLRPLRLLRQPRPIKVMVRPSESRDGEPVSFTDRGEVHRLDHVRGPERITGQWWNGRWKTRDYFDILDTAGGRYWVFRVAQTGQWFLHGLFE